MNLTCPGCRYDAEETTPMPGNTRIEPEPGTVSICWNCAFVGVFDPELNIREPSRSELASFARDKRLMRIVRSVKNRGLLE